MNSDSVIIINTEVENLLPDQPTRSDVLNKIDDIKSLESQDRKLSFYIISDHFKSQFENFYNAVNGNIIKGYYPVFYYEIPKILYDWLTKNDLKSLLNQISLYFGYLLNVISDSKGLKVLNNELESSPLKKIIYNTEKAINDTEVEKIDLFKYRDLYAKFLHRKPKDTVIKTIKYWKLSEKYLKQLPIDPLLTDDFNIKSDWNAIYENYGFKYNVYTSVKGYKNIHENRLKRKVESYDNDYTNQYLYLWKIFFTNPSIKSKVIDNKLCIGTGSKHSFKNNLRLCENCGDDLLKILLYTGEVKESKPLCIDCYLEEYFE